MLRVGRRAIVAFPNFGHWRVRLVACCAAAGRPRPSCFRYEWYDSPNIHFLTVHDFEDLVRSQGWTAERGIFLGRQRRVSTFPNLLAETAVFLVRK